MKNNRYTNTEIYADSIMQSIYGMLIFNRDIRSFSLLDLDISETEIKEIMRREKRINVLGNGSFTLDKYKITVNENTIDQVKPYLYTELSRICDTQDDIFKSFDLAVYFSPFFSLSKKDHDKFADNEYYDDYIKRFVTHESYLPETLQTFDRLIDKILHLKTEPLSVPDFLVTEKFDLISLRHRLAWRKIVNRLMIRKLKVGDTVTDCFRNPALAARDIEWLKSTDEIPAIVDIADYEFVITPTYFEDDTTILPYIFPFFNFGYINQTTQRKLLRSCFR